MSDITITNGLPAGSPWTLANSDVTKLDQANLINLAVGQLALLGASQGQTLQVQTGVLKELIGGVETVNKQLDFLSSVNSSPSSWSGKPVDLGFPTESIGWKVPASTSLTSADITLVDKMIAITSNTVSPNLSSIDFKAAQGIKYSLTLNAVNQVYVSKPVILGKFNPGSSDPPSLDTITLNDLSLRNTIENGQLFSLINDTGGLKSYSYVSGKFVQNPPTLNLEYFVIPQSAAELQNWQILASADSTGTSSAEIAVKSTSSLSSTFLLAPNTLPQTNPESDPAPTNALKMDINAGTAFDKAKYVTNSFISVYTTYPPLQVKAIDSALMIPANIGTVVQVGTDIAEYIYADSYGVIKSAKIESTEPFFYKPTEDQIISWKSQYAEKIIIITQRSSDQQLFVSNLAQKYQYAFDAATYVLKAFTAMLSSAANNV